MTLKRCRHCGAEGDDAVNAITHKSNCKSTGKDETYKVISTGRPTPAVASTPKTVTAKFAKSKSKSKSKRGRY